MIDTIYTGTYYKEKITDIYIARKGIESVRVTSDEVEKEQERRLESNKNYLGRTVVDLCSSTMIPDYEKIEILNRVPIEDLIKIISAFKEVHKFSEREVEQFKKYFHFYKVSKKKNYEVKAHGLFYRTVNCFYEKFLAKYEIIARIGYEDTFIRYKIGRLVRVLYTSNLTDEDKDYLHKVDYREIANFKIKAEQDRVNKWAERNFTPISDMSDEQIMQACMKRGSALTASEMTAVMAHRLNAKLKHLPAEYHAPLETMSVKYEREDDAVEPINVYNYDKEIDKLVDF